MTCGPAPDHPVSTHVLLGAVSLTWSAVLVAGGTAMFSALQDRRPEPVESLAIGVLAARHAVEGAVWLFAPAQVRRVCPAVDLTHAVSMVILAATTPRCRRAAVLSGAVAATMALLGVRSGRGS